MKNFPASVDVAVIGGGTAGVIAALQAARAGAKTALIEIGSQLGGTMTTGGVNFPGLFHAWGKQVIAGIGWSLVLETVHMGGGSLPDFTLPQTYTHWLNHVLVNGALYAVLAEDAVVRAGVHLHYYTLPISVEATDRGWYLKLLGKGETYPLDCRQLIDCTGNAAVVDLAGFPRQRASETQPGTLMFRLGGYDVDRLDAAVIQAEYERALAEGSLLLGDFQHAHLPFMHFLHNGGSNAQHIPHADSATASAHTAANIAGRQSLLRLLRFVRTLPGCEDTLLETMAVETGVRETYRIVGASKVTVDDYCAGKRYADAVCYTYYPIDLHTSEGVAPQPLAEGVVPTIPLSALVPKGSRNLLVAGRCISSDQLANSALRVQASCMAMGQAAGAAAALATATGVTPMEVPLPALKDLLREHGALVP